MSFFRRSRSTSTPRPQSASASSSAQLAAAQAFMANRQSQSNLSASAAATALRTMSPQPTPVEQIQTKRMIQRQTSGSSTGSAGRGRARVSLNRQNSSGSMTERTFRSPSPARQAAPPDVAQHPPVPKVPQTFATPPKANRIEQSASVRAQPAQINTSSPQKSQRTTSASSPVSPNDSRNSINFSYPRASSPLVRPATALGNERPQPQLQNGISKSDALNIQYDLAETASKPVRKKKKKVAGGSTEGSHLSAGGMGSKPITQPLGPGPDPESVVQSTQPVPKKKKKKAVAVTGQSSHFPSSSTSTQSESDSDLTPEQIQEQRAKRASGTLVKRPSVVREDWEGEQEQQEGQGSEKQTTPTVQPIERDMVGMSPVTSPTTVQSKKPIIEANVSKKIEDPNGSIKKSLQDSATPAAVVAPAVNTIETPKPPHPQEIQPIRNASLSPSRSTRFSDRLSSDLTAGRKHDPLPRSVSPGKSALKHPSPSPQSSPVDPSFPRIRGSSAAPSEASDTSNLSGDGASKRKKAHVSFDTDPEIIGTAAEPPTPSSATVTSPQNKEPSKKGWFGLGKSKPSTLETISADDDMEEVMKPRPQLPSFGSIRGRSQHQEQSEAERVTKGLPNVGDPSTNGSLSTSATSSEASSNSNLAPVNISASSDHAIGGLLHREAQKRTDPVTIHDPVSNLPLPPEVTSVEGSGYVSDSESDLFADDEHLPTVTEVPEPVIAHQDNVVPIITAPKPKESTALTDEAAVPSEPADLTTSTLSTIPLVSVQPPTPALEHSSRSDQWAVEVPGGFPLSDDFTEPVAIVDQAASNTDSAGLGIGASEHATFQDPTEDLEDNTDSSNDSIYSDAAEDLSDIEEAEAFGSIDAIVDSPIGGPVSPRSPPESPLVGSPIGEQVSRTTSWEQARARWSGIAQQSRNGAVPKSMAVAQAEQMPKSAPKPKKKTKAKPSTGISKEAPRQGGAMPNRSPVQKANQSSSYPMLDRRANEENMAGFRSTMRTGSGAQADIGFRHTKQSKINAQAQPAAYTPIKSRTPTTQPKAALQKKIIPTAAAASVIAPPGPRPLPRTITNDSDSESSFRKRRKNRASESGRYSMRRSMRSDGASERLGPAGLTGPRPNSPEIRRPFSPTDGQRSLRTSMRGSIGGGAPTLRGQPEPKKSSSIFGKSIGKSPPRPSNASAGMRLKSRFADSDDEDEPRPLRYQSRFGDSSDDEPTQFRPVRGIPRRGDDGDSTDLEDSSDEEKIPASKKAQTPNKITIPNIISPVESPVSPSSEKKRGFFGRLRRKDKDDSHKSSNVTVANAPASRPGTSSKPDDSRLGFSSAAERDAMIEQTRVKLEAARDDRPQSPPNQGKLQRRHTPQRIMSDTWPLPPPIPEDVNEDRPRTAETNPEQGSPMMDRIGDGRVYGKTGKKKRFPMLRKAFGLKD